MRETWYILENGMLADPNEVAPDDSGVLRHSSGVAVAYSEFGPRSSGVDVESKMTKPEPAKRSYKTRDAKAEK